MEGRDCIDGGAIKLLFVGKVDIAAVPAGQAT